MTPLETAIAEIVKQGGGYLLAFVAMTMLNEVWRARLRDQCTQTEREAATTKILLDTLEANTAVKKEVVLTMQAMQVEIRATSAQILDSIKDLANSATHPQARDKRNQ